MQRKQWWVFLAVIALVASACSAAAPSTAPRSAAPASQAPSSGAAGSEAPGSEAPASEEPSASEGPTTPALPAVPTGYTELDQALGADKPMAGKKVSMQTQWILGEGENFAASIADFEEATGIDIAVDQIASQHEVTLRTRIEGKTPPDLAVLAQPSAVVTYGDRGQTLDVSQFMDATRLGEEFPALIPLLTGDGGEIWGIPYKVDVKSTIWYPIKAF